MKTKKNLQDVILNSLRKNKNQVTMFLTNGFQIRGTITSFDTYVVVIMSEDKQQIVFKHAISTIVPSKAVEIICEEREEEVENS